MNAVCVWLVSLCLDCVSSICECMRVYVTSNRTKNVNVTLSQLKQLKNNLERKKNFSVVKNKKFSLDLNSI